MSQYQEISDRELYNAMKLHFDYLRSKGAEGERLDLRGYDLNRRHFQNYNFGGAILSGTNQACQHACNTASSYHLQKYRLRLRQDG